MLPKTEIRWKQTLGADVLKSIDPHYALFSAVSARMQNVLDRGVCEGSQDFDVDVYAWKSGRSTSNEAITFHHKMKAYPPTAVARLPKFFQSVLNELASHDVEMELEIVFTYNPKG